MASIRERFHCSYRAFVTYSASNFFNRASDGHLEDLVVTTSQLHLNWGTFATFIIALNNNLAHSDKNMYIIVVSEKAWVEAYELIVGECEQGTVMCV